MPTNSQEADFQVDGRKLATGINNTLHWLLVLSIIALILMMVSETARTYDTGIVLGSIIFAIIFSFVSYFFA